MKKITKAVIPVGGEGSRMFPISKAYPKEFVPLRDSNGNVKPAIMYLIEELVDAGIEEIYIVVSKESQKKFYEDFFYNDVTDLCKKTLSKESIEYLKRLNDISKKIRVFYKENIRGFGHVLYYCNEFINNEDFLLLLGDQVYKSNMHDSCIKQILDNYTGNLTITASKVSLDDVDKYGIMCGEYINGDSFIIDEIKEKPTKLYAKENLTMDNDSYYSVFGTYIFNKKFISGIKNFFDNEKELCDEYQLTPFINDYSDKKIAFIPDGEYYDIGNYESYDYAYKEFQKKELEVSK